MRIRVRAMIVLMGLAWAACIATAHCAAADPATQDRFSKCDKPSATTGKDPELRLLRQKLAAALALADGERYQDADRELGEVIANARFDTLPAEEARTALSRAGSVALQIDAYDRAREWLRRAIAMSADDADDWYRLSLVEYALQHYDDAALAFVHLTEYWPELLVNADTSHIYRMIQKTGKSSDARLRLLQALWDARWQDPERIADDVWYDLALMRIERGETDAARAAIKRIVSPKPLVWLRSDKRFDAVVDREARAFDVGAAAKRAVEIMRDKVAAGPEKLDIQVQLSYAMLTAGMNREVIEHATSLLDAIADAPAGKAPFEDIHAQVWLMNNRAIALRRLGRVDEALDELRRASGLIEGGHRNVSQVLNLGDFYCSLGRPDDALSVIDSVGDEISDYGRMVEMLIRLRAYLQKGDRAGVERALEYIRAHDLDASGNLLDALLRTGHLDEAAAKLIESLSDPATRQDMLEWVQEFREAAQPLPGNRDYEVQYRKLMQRDDVRATIDRIGRIERHDIWGAFGMD